MLKTDYKPEQKVGRRPGANNLPGATASKPCWTEDTMLMAKLIAWCAAVQRAGGEDRLVNYTEWAPIGVTGKILLSEVRRILPHFDEVWARQGRPNEERIKEGNNGILGRVYNMYRILVYKKVDGKRRYVGRVNGYSAEHPQNSKVLGPYRDLAKKLFIEGKPVSRERLRQLMEAVRD